MKKHIYLFSVIMLASTLFMAAPAKASTIIATTTSNNSNSLLGDLLGLLGFGTPSGSGSTGGTGGSGTQLPINNGVMFLMIAGVVIGITAVKKNKLTKLA